MASPLISLITNHTVPNMADVDARANATRDAQIGRDMLIKKTRDEQVKQDALAEIQRTATYVRDTVQPLLQAGKVDELKQNLTQRIQVLEQGGRDSSGSRQALDLLNAGNYTELDRVSRNVVKVAQDHKLLPESYEQVYQDGKIVAQRNVHTGEEKKSPRAGEALKGKQRVARLPDGSTVPAIELESGHLVDPSTGKRLDNAILAPKQTEQATVKDFRTPSQRGKDQQAMTESKIALTQNIRDMAKLENLITSDKFIGGVAGQATSIVNSVFAQARQLYGSDPLIAGGKLNVGEFAEGVSEDTLSRFRDAAINRNRFDSAILELAFLKAKSLNPDGKISDADVRAAEEILGAGADKASRLAVLRDIMERSVEHFNIEMQVKDPENYRPITLDEVMGRKVSAPAPGAKTESTDDIASRLLRDEGLK